MVAAALIGAGASLLGGLFGANSEKKAIAAQNEYNKPINIRARAEEGGFNPLLFVGPGVGNQTATGGSNYMGSAIANAGLAIADGIDKEKWLEIERSKLAQDKQRLDLLLTNATIRPKSGGIYASTVSTPSRGGVGASGVPLTFGIKPSGSEMMAAVEGYAPDLTKITATSDESKAIPVVPYSWGGQWFTPHPDYPDATLTEDYLGDDGPPSFVANSIAGMQKMGYHFGQTKAGMIANGYLSGEYQAAKKHMRNQAMPEPDEAFNAGRGKFPWE